VARAYVGVGSNLGDREALVGSALRALGEEAGIEVEAVSSVRETDPVGPVEQPKFLNAVAQVSTTLPPRALLDSLLAVERRLGRTRDGPRFGPRTIDLDLLLYGDEIVSEPGLEVPHPRLRERRFVLEPLLELSPDLAVPGNGTVRELLAALD
jgi:2-amino-4-hydroxy-6-hydroxymethyldihydropteridine diphosphokinase